MTVHADRVQVVTTTTGTGTLSLGLATEGHRTFGATVGDGAEVTYLIQSGTAWEVGAGVVTTGTPDTLTRVLSSSSTGALLDLPAGTHTVTLVVAAATIDAALLGNRNKIINGKMEIAQRGTSFAAAADNQYTLDRFLIQKSGAAVLTVEQSADAPSDEFQNSLRATITTADATVDAGDILVIEQKIEGHNVRDLIGRDFTLKFRVRSAKTGVHCVALRNSANDHSYVAEYTVNAANTWETKTITVPGGLITAGTWNWTNGSGLGVSWAMQNGTDRQTTPNAWNTGNFLSTANQVNVADTVGNIFAITGVQLEAGSVATPFEHRSYGEELALCQRYYELQNVRIGGYITSGNHIRTSEFFRVMKRAAPSGVTLSTPESVNVGGLLFDSFTIRDYRFGVAPVATGVVVSTKNFAFDAEL